MKRFKIDGKPCDIPTCWDEVSFRKFVSLTGKSDEAELISIMTDLPVSQVRGAKIEGLDLMLQSLKFLSKTPLIDEEPINVGGYVIPKNVGFETIEQFEDSKQIINSSMKDEDPTKQVEALATLAAIYCAGVNEKYDSDKALALAEKFKELPCLEVLSVGSFFHVKFLSIHSGLTTTYLRRKLLFRKKRPGLARFLRRLGFTLSLIPSRVT